MPENPENHSVAYGCSWDAGAVARLQNRFWFYSFNDTWSYRTQKCRAYLNNPNVFCSYFYLLSSRHLIINSVGGFRGKRQHDFSFFIFNIDYLWIPIFFFILMRKQEKPFIDQENIIVTLSMEVQNCLVPK